MHAGLSWCFHTPLNSEVDYKTCAPVIFLHLYTRPRLRPPPPPPHTHTDARTYAFSRARAPPPPHTRTQARTHSIMGFPPPPPPRPPTHACAQLGPQLIKTRKKETNKDEIKNSNGLFSRAASFKQKNKTNNKSKMHLNTDVRAADSVGDVSNQARMFDKSTLSLIHIRSLCYFKLTMYQL